MDKYTHNYATPEMEYFQIHTQLRLYFLINKICNLFGTLQQKMALQKHPPRTKVKKTTTTKKPNQKTDNIF